MHGIENKTAGKCCFRGNYFTLGGGRVPQIDTITEKELFSIIEEYNSRNISCFFTFSNYRIEKEHLTDYIGNLVCKVLDSIQSNSQKQVNNGLIISSDMLSEYVKNKYPDIKQAASVIKPTYEIPQYNETPDYYNKLCEKFDSVCIQPEFNTNKKFLKELKYKNKIELMVNQTCLQKCPLAQLHYDRSVKYTIDDNEATKRNHFCNKKVRNIYSIYERVNNSSEQIDEMIKLGFYNLKLKGRGVSPYTFLSSIVGRYIFSPTGYFPLIEDHILNRLGLI